MSILTTYEPQTRLSAPPPPAQPNYLNVRYGILSWLLTTDHKRIGILYLVSVTVMFFLGGLAATMVRLELMTPQGDFMSADTYNKMFTAHGIIMIFFFLVPVVPAVLGNFVLPIAIGCKDLAFPRVNLASWYIYILGAVVALWAMLSGGVDTGWTFYTPYSTRGSTTNVVPTLFGAVIAGFSSIFTGLNFLVTVHRMRAPGMTWFRMPLFVWSLYATSIIQLLATPVLAMTLVLAIVERVFGVGIFDPKLDGDPILFQHLFWFYSHPAVYIMILPGMGIVSEVLTCFARKPIFGYTMIAMSSMAIAVFGFIVWAHHMFVAGQSVYSALLFSLLSYSVAIPSAIKVFNWTATLYRGSITLETPMLFALGFIGLFTIGGLTGLFLAALGTNVHLHGTYFVVAHFHFIMVGGMVMAYMSGLHFWWPKMTGRMYSDYWGRISAMLVFVGFILTFLPQFVAGYIGMPRRYHTYAPEFQVYNVMSTAGASILAVGYLLPLIYLIGSLFYGEKAGPNPWHATGLEWQTSSPPPPENFAVTPVVTSGPYNYAPEQPHEQVG
jgi:cytochrome c oxidase subunit 1